MSILQLILIQSYNCLCFPLVVTVSNSYYTRFHVQLNTHKFYFCRENIIEKELVFYYISTSWYNDIQNKVDGIRNQYCGITT